jgi:hypothetical protein
MLGWLSTNLRILLYTYMYECALPHYRSDSPPYNWL